METHDDPTVAAVFRAALTLGIATPADLVPWADEQIMARDRPPMWIIDLSVGAAVPADRVIGDLHDVGRLAAPAGVFRILVGLANVSDVWSADAARRAADWLWNVAHQYADDPAVESTAGAYADEFWLAATDFADHPRTPAVVAELIPAVAELIRRHADPAAREWLPGVRVRFDNGGLA